VTASQGWVAIQHVPFEGPGLIVEAAAASNVELRACHVYRGEPLPSVTEIGGLVVMGGPMGVGDAAQHPYLKEETELIAAAVDAGRPVLGVCLGAQLLAHALGANVDRGEEPEIGMGTVTRTPEGRQDPVFGGLASDAIPVMHWHQDTFELPGGAEWLARSELYAHQAFRAGRCAYGLQFHVEVDRELADGWAEHLPAGLTIMEVARVEVERAGRTMLRSFFELAAS
jgi:GMP synthase-like glutamine amidotransferase